MIWWANLGFVGGFSGTRIPEGWKKYGESLAGMICFIALLLVAKFIPQAQLQMILTVGKKDSTCFLGIMGQNNIGVFKITKHTIPMCYSVLARCWLYMIRSGLGRQECICCLKFCICVNNRGGNCREANLWFMWFVYSSNHPLYGLG